MKEINRIVFYGCSFTVGSELSDCKLFPQMTKQEIDNLKRKERYAFYNRINPIVRDNADNQQSWARWFSDELGLPWVNRATGGSSMGQIIFSLEKDLADNNINDDDLIIVGITSPERLCRFLRYGANSLIINNLDTRWDKETFRNDYIKYIANDDYILFNWYKDIKYLDLLSHKLQGRLHQQWVWATMKEIFEFHSNGTPFYSLYDYTKSTVHSDVKFDSIIDDTISFTALNSWTPENQEVFHHPKLKLHHQFGKLVAQRFLEKVNFTKKLS